MKIAFDSAKQAKTLAERGLDFRRCNEVFAANHMTLPDDRRDYGEPRFMTVGTLDSRMVVVVWTPRNGNCRIISMRRANDREQKIHGPRLA